MTFKLGGRPPRIDERTFCMSSIIRPENLPALPDAYDLDSSLGVKDNFVFGNDTYGDCVIAARAHMTLRFEAFEQRRQIAIADTDVTGEYFRETGGQDTGLVMLDSLNKWRQDGWSVGGKTYKIHAYLAVDWKNHDEVRRSIQLLRGVYVALALPLAAQSQIGKVWDITNSGSSEAAPASWGYHAVYAKAWTGDAPPGPTPSKCRFGNGLAAALNTGQRLRGRVGRFYYMNPAVPRYRTTGYTAVGPVVITWGLVQQCTWAWWDNYVSEAYAVIDDRDAWLGNDSPVDVDKLDQLLSEITRSN